MSKLYRVMYNVFALVAICCAVLLVSINPKDSTALIVVVGTYAGLVAAAGVFGFLSYKACKLWESAKEWESKVARRRR